MQHSESDYFNKQEHTVSLLDIILKVSVQSFYRKLLNFKVTDIFRALLFVGLTRSRTTDEESDGP